MNKTISNFNTNISNTNDYNNKTTNINNIINNNNNISIHPGYLTSTNWNRKNNNNNNKSKYNRDSLYSAKLFNRKNVKSARPIIKKKGFNNGMLELPKLNVEKIIFKKGEVEKLLNYEFYKSSYKLCIDRSKPDNVTNSSIKKNYKNNWKMVEQYTSDFRNMKFLSEDDNFSNNNNSNINNNNNNDNNNKSKFFLTDTTYNQNLETEQNTATINKTLPTFSNLLKESNDLLPIKENKIILNLKTDICSEEHKNITKKSKIQLLKEEIGSDSFILDSVYNFKKKKSHTRFNSGMFDIPFLSQINL
jgi:hypothetical protein